MVNYIAVEEIVEDGVRGLLVVDENGNEHKFENSSVISAVNKGLVKVKGLKVIDCKLVVDGNIKEEYNLVKELNEARKVYEQGVDEIISNYEYDKKYDRLQELEEKTGIIFKNSPVHNVGYEVISELVKEEHETKMLSLGKTKSVDDLKTFLLTDRTVGNREGILSWKLDGLTVVLTYNNGILVKAVTRGNGEVGEVVTHNARQFRNIPLNIAYKGKLVLRGEAIIKYSVFEEINSKILDTDEKYKNPRNLCSGTVRNLDSSVASEREVNWICFELVNWRDVCSKNLDEQFKYLEGLGFETVDFIKVNVATIDGAIAKFKELVGSSDYPSDGLVLALNDKEYGESLGCTAKFPRHSIAFKWQDENVGTTLENIEWTVGRSGIVTPTAVFKPIDIEGSTVARASMHNISVMREQLGMYPYKGQRIWIYKANMIIPQIGDSEISNEEREEYLRIPNTCPRCGGALEIRTESNSGVKTLWCTNDNCGGANLQKFKHAVTRDALNIDGISEATLETFIEAGFISELADLFNLDRYANLIINMSGFGNKSYDNIMSAVEKARDIKASNFIYALGIPNIGLNTAKLISKNLELDDESSGYLEEVTWERLSSIPGIGDTIADNFVSWFENSDNLNEYVNLWKELNISADKSAEGSMMNGLTFCVTGDVYRFPNRRAVKDYIENNGGKLTGSVSRSTSYLITNDTTSGSAKNKAAQEYNIPILSEDDFIEKFNIQI